MMETLKSQPFPALLGNHINMYQVLSKSLPSSCSSAVSFTWPQPSHELLAALHAFTFAPFPFIWV